MSTPYWMTREFIRTIPKSDLHVHLDGSLRLETLIELARGQGGALPSPTSEGLRASGFKPPERVAYELALDCFAEGVCYIEPRFAPQLHVTDELSFEEVLRSVDRGLARAKSEINGQHTIQSGEEPPFDYGLIGCALKKFNEHFSPYYREFVSCHRYSPLPQVYPLASLELVRALVEIRDRAGVPIVGFDLAGEERGWPPNAHRKAFEFAHQHFLKKTVHAGEAYGPSSIFQAITQCYADRIGHGTHLFASALVEHIPPSERPAYTRALVHYIADRRITIEVCPTSNLQTIPTIHSMEEHPVGK